MQTIAISSRNRILCLGAHSDDIEIGCGATVLKLCKENPGLEVAWVVFSAEGKRSDEAHSSARAFLHNANKEVIEIKDFRGGFFPWQGMEIKERFEELKQFNPDAVFTHHRDDRHQDHRVISELAWNTFRNHLILEYEIPKYDGDLGQPNVFVPASKAVAERKVKLLLKHFKSQVHRHWFDRETFMGLMRLRGMECASKSGYAEAFFGRKLVLD
jgi:LmbE family N-acetylglucosaminyl deacetylase